MFRKITKYFWRGYYVLFPSKDSGGKSNFVLRFGRTNGLKVTNLKITKKVNPTDFLGLPKIK